MEVSEGGLTYVVPADEDTAFFNPAMELNRDITVATLRVARDELLEAKSPTYLDAMAASGIRGARAASAGYDVTVCDRSEAALAYARENLERHGIDATVTRDDVRRVLTADRFDVVDIDPFGSPMPYADAAARGTDGLLCVTATDTAPLCGAHLPAGKRRYASVPAITTDHPEVGLRTLIGALARTCAVHDVAIEPLVSHTTRHYHRTYLAVEASATAADGAVAQVGFLQHCDACHWRETAPGLNPPLVADCPRCGAAVTRIGPLWLGPYRDEAFTRSVADAVDDAMGEATAARRLLSRLADEADRVGHVDHHDVCDRLGVPAGPLDAVLEGLSDRGHTATRTHFGGTTLKTDAPTSVIESVVAETAADT